MKTQVWAHRGASGHRPENTLDAFALAMEMGADGIELDVQLSADGEVVVIHDETVDRVTEGRGRVAELTLRTLKSLNAAHTFPGSDPVRVPTLAEVFALLRPTGLTINVELKNSREPYPGLEEKCIALAREMGVAERVWFSSFQHYSLVRIKEIAPEFPCGLLYDATMVRPWQYARALGMDALHPHYTELSVLGEVEESHRAGIRVHTWTVNRETELRFAIGAGVDAVITNYPDRARALLGKIEDIP